MARPRLPIALGDTFGHYTVCGEREAHQRHWGGGTVRMIDVQCVCGTIRSVPLHHLRAGKSKSCGCHGQA